MASKGAAVLFLGLICFQVVTAQIVMDCCLSFTEKRLIPKNIVSYSIQREGTGCDISATVFVNKKGLKLCVAPPEGNVWVQKLIKILERRRTSLH